MLLIIILQIAMMMINFLGFKVTLLLFSDGKRTVIKAYGLCKNPPHKKLSLECHFKKTKITPGNLKIFIYQKINVANHLHVCV